MHQVSIDPKYNDKLIEINAVKDIPARWHNTPIENFIKCQNFGYSLQQYQKPQVLISACMEFRYALPVPANYAYVIRTAGGRLIGAELAVGYAIFRGVEHILLIAHNDCGMARLADHKSGIIEAFVKQGWTRASAEEYVHAREARYSIPDELETLHGEYLRLKNLFRHIHVAPLFLTLADKRVHLPGWYREFYEREAGHMTALVPDEDIRDLS